MKKNFRWSAYLEMHTVVPEFKNDVVSITHFDIGEKEKRAMLYALIGGDPYAQTNPNRRYARLHVKTADGWTLMMTDTDMEQRTNTRFLYHANGDVLIAGLGLGMIVHPLLKNPDITSVTIIEKYQAVIDAVGPTLPDPRVTIICADIDTWLPEPGKVFDTVYFDIWPDRSEENFPQINRLHRRAKKYLNKSNPDAWVGSWYHLELKVMRDRDNRAARKYGS